MTMSSQEFWPLAHIDMFKVLLQQILTLCAFQYTVITCSTSRDGLKRCTFISTIVCNSQ